MNFIRLTLPLLLTVPLHAGPLLAASSDWHQVEGGAIRVVTSGAPDADGVLRGALEIRLEPGWKTYWRDPGSSGVPPSLDVEADGRPAAVEVAFPAPQRFDDGYSPWAGYDGTVSLALTFSLPPDAATARIKASAFLGLCETICVPVQAEMVLEPDARGNDPVDAAVVEAAFGALPPPAEEGFLARAVAVEDGAVVVEAVAPAGAEVVDLFVAGTDTLSLDTPRRIEGDGAMFRVPFFGSPGKELPDDLAYTLVTSAGAVAGRLALP